MRRVVTHVHLDAEPAQAPNRRPLVLDARGRLYLRRYWEHERSLAAGFWSRAWATPPVDEAALATWNTGGRVFAVDPDDVPQGAEIAAVFRY